MNARSFAISAIAAGVLLSMGCVSVSAPREVHVGSGGPPPIDSSRVPETNSHAEAREELIKAYQNVRYLEDELADCRSDRKECERELDRCEDRLERYED